ncbi:MAG: hypothetical protein U0Z53_18350 [Blastocatellia bacterium]
MFSCLRDPLNDSTTGSLPFSASLKSFLLGLCVCLAVSLVTSPVFAISRQVNLNEMTAGAGRVVYGRISEVRSGVHPDYNHIAVLFVTLDVIEMLKGSATTRITFMQFAGAAQGRTHNYHLPKYAVGEEVVLFLYAESRYGFTSPVGEGQGKFQVSNDPRTGRPALLNERGNHLLFEPLKNETAMSRLKLNAAERALITQQRGAADLDTFRSVVRKLVTSGSVVKTS